MGLEYCYMEKHILLSKAAIQAKKAEKRSQLLENVPHHPSKDVLIKYWQFTQ